MAAHGVPDYIAKLFKSFRLGKDRMSQSASFVSAIPRFLNTEYDFGLCGHRLELYLLTTPKK